MKYFAYGSNMELEQMALRCTDSQLIGPAKLENHRLDFTRYSPGWGCGVADVIKDKSHSVWGLLFSISEKDLESLDRYEGYPKYYTRKTVSILSRNKLHSDVTVYYVVNKSQFHKPNEDYFNIILKTSKHFEFPASYNNYLKSIIQFKSGLKTPKR